MAKTLVALYNTCADAERVVQELLKDGFTRSDVHLALDHTEGCETPHAAVEWNSAHEGDSFFETLVDLGVPHEEAHAYAEGVRRGGALVVIESSDERAERGMEILQRLHPVDIHARTAQWRQEGWTGAGGHAGAAATAGTQGRQRPPQRGTEDTDVRIPVVEED